MKLWKISLLLPTLFFGCGYHPVYQSGTHVKKVTILPIQGDREGLLREAIAEKLHETGLYTYTSSSSAPYALQVDIEALETKQVGYDWECKGEEISHLTPNESRTQCSLRITLYDRLEKKNLFPPLTLFSSVDFDFVNPTSETQRCGSILQHSRGELDSEEGAKDSAYAPLTRALARKVIDALSP